MDSFKKLQNQIASRIVLIIFVCTVIATGSYIAISTYSEASTATAFAVSALIGMLASLIAGQIIAKHALEPLRLVRQGILHVTPGASSLAPPNLEETRLGRELISSLVLQVYQLASLQEEASKESKQLEQRRELLQATNIVGHLPLPLFVFNKDRLVTNASESALKYCAIDSSELLGKPLYDSLTLEFPTEHTLEKWLDECQSNKISDSNYWERVRLKMPDGQVVKQCDIAGYYNRDNPSGTEFIITLFDRTAQYNRDDESMGFIALAVHELRTPLTMLRGYIEVVQEEADSYAKPEIKGYLSKMEASASQLTTFINTILNVSRVEANQLSMELHEEDWPKLLRKSCKDAEMRAKAHGIDIIYKIPKGLPKVAVDRTSIYEVLNNLLENAIKYSPKSKKIIVSSRLDDNEMIETTVQDFGRGIPSNILPYLFSKFYRSHRTKTEVGGTGLGLYLCKAIIEAHGGQVWAKSKEGEGSTFGFTLQTYDQLADEFKNSDNNVTRTAHGWIKNHSYFRK